MTKEEKNWLGTLNGFVLNLRVNLERADIFLILRLPIPEHGLSSRFSLISLTKVTVLGVEVSYTFHLTYSYKFMLFML